MKIEKHSGDSKTLFPSPCPRVRHRRPCVLRANWFTDRDGRAKDHHLRKRYFLRCSPPRRKSDVCGRRLSKDLDFRRKWKIPFKTPRPPDPNDCFPVNVHVYYIRAHTTKYETGLYRDETSETYTSIAFNYCVQSTAGFPRTAVVDMFPVLYSFKSKKSTYSSYPDNSSDPWKKARKKTLKRFKHF